jgi:hypothetical protein
MVLLAGGLALAPAAAHAAEPPFDSTIRQILQNVMGGDLSPDVLRALQNCSINAFAAFTPEQRQGLIDAGVAGGDKYLQKLDLSRVNVPAFDASTRCWVMLRDRKLIGSPQAAEPPQ